MQILSIHNNYQIRGGEEESREAEERLLRQMGHEVDVYEESNDRLGSLNPLSLAIRSVWSQESYQMVQKKLSLSTYDIVHVQNYFPLISPSVYYAAKSRGVPVIQTLRNYRLLCPNALFFRDGKVCEDCMGKKIPYPGVLHRCYRNSLGASAGAASMITFHRFLDTWTKQVDLYIALSNFARNKFIEGGLPPEKIVVKPNFVSPDPGLGSGAGGYALYVGRLSVEKGLDVLLSAWEILNQPIPLKIIGDGPLSDFVLAATQKMPWIEWLGRRNMDEVHAFMGEAMVLIFPSKWYETFGRVAVEAFAKGTPVIASNLGAIAELIEHERTGLLFNPSDAKDLAIQVDWLLSHSHQLAQMRVEARQKFVENFTEKENYQQLMSIYRTVQTRK